MIKLYRKNKIIITISAVFILLGCIYLNTDNCYAYSSGYTVTVPENIDIGGSQQTVSISGGHGLEVSISTPESVSVIANDSFLSTTANIHFNTIVKSSGSTSASTNISATWSEGAPSVGTWNGILTYSIQTAIGEDSAIVSGESVKNNLNYSGKTITFGTVVDKPESYDSLYDVSVPSSPYPVWAYCNNSDRSVIICSPNQKPIVTYNMDGMFDNIHYSLESVNFNNCLDTGNVTTMSKLFKNCYSLNSVNLSGVNTHATTDMSEMFSGCSSLINLSMANLDVANVANTKSMFKSTYSLTNLDLTGWHLPKTCDSDDMFDNIGSDYNYNYDYMDRPYITINGWNNIPNDSWQSAVWTTNFSGTFVATDKSGPEEFNNYIESPSVERFSVLKHNYFFDRNQIANLTGCRTLYKAKEQIQAQNFSSSGAISLSTTNTTISFPNSNNTTTSMFTSGSTGITCNTTGVVSVSFSIKINTGLVSGDKFYAYITKNGATALTTYQTVNGSIYTHCFGPHMFSVNAGDVIGIQVANKTASRGAISATNGVMMSLEYVPSTTPAILATNTSGLTIPTDFIDIPLNAEINQASGFSIESGNVKCLQDGYVCISGAMRINSGIANDEMLNLTIEISGERQPIAYQRAYRTSQEVFYREKIIAVKAGDIIALRGSSPAGSCNCNQALLNVRYIENPFISLTNADPESLSVSERIISTHIVTDCKNFALYYDGSMPYIQCHGSGMAMISGSVYLQAAAMDGDKCYIVLNKNDTDIRRIWKSVGSECDNLYIPPMLISANDEDRFSLSVYNLSGGHGQFEVGTCLLNMRFLTYTPGL